MKQESQTVSLTGAAEIIGVSTQTVLALVADGELSMSPGRRFSLAEVRAYAARPVIPNNRRRIARY